MEEVDFWTNRLHSSVFATSVRSEAFAKQ